MGSEMTKLVECAKCGAVLNGMSLWIVGSADPKTICEECYSRKEHLKIKETYEESKEEKPESAGFNPDKS